MTTWVGTSWKMNKTIGEARRYARALAATDSSRWPGVQPFIIPPATSLAAVRDELGDDTHVLLGAQNAHWEDSGPWTGEVSVLQVADAGARLVEIGHSERRQHFGETDATVNLKVAAAQRHGLIPLVCVGEPSDVFHAGRSVPHVVEQVRAALAGVDSLERVLVAYEPVWAIGDGGRPANPEDITDVVAAIQDSVAGATASVLYGGSVSRGNARDLLAVSGVDGLFIGRAAWEIDGFLAILDDVSAGKAPTKD